MYYEPASYFFEIIRCQSISKAAMELGISQPALSRYLKVIETKIQAKLYTYHKKKIILTPEGEAFATFLKERHHLENLFLDTIHQKKELAGKIIIHTTPAIANSWLMPTIALFMNKHPLVHVSLMTIHKDMSFNRTCDIIISGKINQPNVESVFLKRSKVKFYASKGYLKKFGVPQSVEDLKRHRLITLCKHIKNDFPDVLSLLIRDNENIFNLSSCLKVTTVISSITACQNNMGIIALGSDFIGKHPSLVEVLPNQTSLTIDFYMSYLKKYKEHEPLKSLKLFLKSIRNQ